MEELKVKIESIRNLDGLHVELIGAWIWVSGNTKKHKEILKQNGFYYAPKKVMWYFHLPQHGKVFNRSKPMDMNSIKNKYGSYVIA